MTAAPKLTHWNVLDEFRIHEHFCRAMLDAYAVVDTTGKVVKANQLFSQLVGQNTKQVLKAESFDDLMTLYINKKILSVIDILTYKNPTRIDEVSGAVSGRDNLNLIIGIYPFAAPDRTDTTIGAFILIRDVTAETKLQDKYKDKAIKSITDPLTGLYTRGYFEEYLELQLKALSSLPADSEQKVLSMAMIDLDHFKKVNDMFGHQAGDHVLKAVASIMRQVFRRTDVVCRYGGEEFLIILPSTDIHGASLASEKLRIAIEQHKIIFEGTHIPVTVSIGIAQVLVGKETFTETITRADDALYQAKKTGRNKLCIASEK